MAFDKPILIVEDDSDTRFLYSEVLHSEGYQVLEASDGKAALEVLKANPSVALILTLRILMTRKFFPSGFMLSSF